MLLGRSNPGYLHRMHSEPGNLVVIVGHDGAIRTFNRECERVTGYSRKEVIGANLVDLFVPQEWRTVVLNRFVGATEHELRAPHRNPWKTKLGVPVMIEWRCSYLPSIDGTLVVGFGSVVANDDCEIPNPTREFA
jgi:PAS domain S-box-containing protein